MAISEMLKREIIDRWNNGNFTRKELARKYGLTISGLRHILKRYRKQGGLVLQKDPFTGGQTNLYLPPKLDGYWKLEYRDCIITSDWHLPYLDETLFDKLLEVRKKTRLSTLIIGGDFIDLPMFSTFSDAYEHKGQFRGDKDTIRKILEILVKNFDEIYIIRGNHDFRWVKFLQYEVDMKDLYDMIFVDRKIKVSNYGMMKIGDWRITHPKNYNIFFGKVGRDLAEKFHENICYAHGHQTGITFDRSGDYTVVATGGLVDQKKVDYTSYLDTTHPMWETGFIVLKRGVPYVISKKFSQI
jgi:predicted phosphodiesterase